MNKLPVVFISILLLVGSVLGAATLSVPGHAASTGVVCIIANVASSCPSSTASITGTVGSQLRVSVFLQNSSGISGFDIVLLADHTILRPTGIDLTGSILQGTPTVIVECLQGILVSGPSCANSDTIDTIELAATSALGSGITSTPTTGLLFTALYNVTQKTVGTSLSFQVGCSTTSVGPNVCVTLANGTPTPVPETIETAFVSTSATPDFLISANPNSLTIVEGSSATSTVTLTSINGLNGTALLSTVSPPLCAQPGCSSWTLTPTSLSLSAGGSTAATLSIFAGTAFPGPGNSLSLPINATINGLSHSISVVFTTVAVPVPDFTLQASPTILSVAQGFTGSALLTLGSVQGFNGTVTLAASSSPAGLILSLSQTGVALSPGGTGTSELSVATVSTTPVGSYSVTVTGSAGSISHTVAITVTVTSSTSGGDFTITDSATFLSIPVGSERQTTVTVGSVNGFSGFVQLVAKPSSTAFACWFTTLTNTSTVSVPAGGSANEFPTCGAGRPAGSYSLTITGTSGSLMHAVSLAVNITDFSITGPSAVSFNAGSSSSEALTFSSLSGFAGNIVLTLTSPSGLSVSCPSSVTLTSGGTSTAICSQSSSSPGTYNVTFTGTFVCGDCYFDGKDTNTLSTIVTVFGTGTPDFSINANPSILTIVQGSSASSTITLTSLNGFSGIVSLTITAPSGISATVNPTSINSQGTATLTVTGSSSGTFSAQVTGVSGSISHSITVPVIVTSIGLVCIAQSGSTSCPVSPASLTGAVGTQLRVAVFIQGSGGLNGFDVTLLADHTILRPAGIDLTGTVLVGTPNIVVECLSGVLISGPVCTNTDTIDTIELAATSALGSGVTSTPTTGLLFTAIYNVTGTTSGTSLGFQTGCSTTSVSGGVCVTVANGSTLAVPETVQTATFSNGAAQPDFSITTSPSNLSLGCTGSATSTVTLSSVNGFNGTVSLSLNVAPVGVSATLSPTTVALTAGGSGTSTLTVSLNGASAGTYQITVAGTSGVLAHSTVVSVVVTLSPCFGMTASPTSITMNPGQTGTSTITIAALNGFTGSIVLSATSPAGLTASLNPTSVVLGGTATSVLTISSTSSTPPGSYTITVTGTSGATSQSVTVSVTIAGVSQPDFSLSANPSSIATAPSTPGTSTITLTALNGFSAVVSLTVTASSGITATISPSSVTGSGTATLTVTGSASGTFSVQVTGVSGSISHSITIPVSVTAVGLVCIAQSGSTSCPISPASLTGTVGTQLRVAVFIQNSGEMNGFDVTLLADHTILRPAGIDLTGTVLASPQTIILECLSGVLVSGSICSPTDTVNTLHFVVSGALGVLTTPPTTGLLFTAIYNVTGTTSGTSLGFQTGCSTTSVSGGVCITITNGSILPAPETAQSATFSNSVSQPDFSISASPVAITTTVGVVGSSTITVAPLNGFTGTITLTSSSSPLGLTCTLNPMSIMLGSSQTSTLLCTSSAAGTYTVIITGTSGSLNHSATVTFIVTDFALTATPSSLNIPAGGSATSTVAVTAVNGFMGTVTFAASSPPGLTAKISPTSLLINGGSATATLTITAASSTPPGVYMVTVTGTNGAISHSTTVSVIVPTTDFTITATPTTQTIAKGSSATYTITIKGLNGFNGTISLSTTISPVAKNGPTISLPTRVGPYSNSTLTVSTIRSTPAGTYTITVTATSGSITHRVVITVVVVTH